MKFLGKRGLKYSWWGLCVDPAMWRVDGEIGAFPGLNYQKVAE